MWILRSGRRRFGRSAFDVGTREWPSGFGGIDGWEKGHPPRRTLVQHRKPIMEECEMDSVALASRVDKPIHPWLGETRIAFVPGPDDLMHLEAEWSLQVNKVGSGV